MNAERVKEGVSFVMQYAPNLSEWVLLKKELLKFFNNQERRYFSTRDPVTKKQGLNQLEKLIIELWESMTGTKLNI